MDDGVADSRECAAASLNFGNSQGFTQQCRLTWSLGTAVGCEPNVNERTWLDSCCKRPIDRDSDSSFGECGS